MGDKSVADVAGDTPTPGDTGGARRTRWTRLAALGLVMMGVGPLLLLGASLIWGLDVGGEAGFFVAAIVVPWLAAFLVLRFGRWAKIVAIVAALLGAPLLVFTALGLTSPTSFFDFVPGVLMLPGAIIAITGSVASLVAGRRGHTLTGRDDRERRAITIVVAVVGALAVVSGVLTVATRSSADTSAAASQVAMKDFAFDQAGYDVTGGTQLAVRNDDPFRHTFTIDALGIDVKLGPGSSSLVDIPLQPGTYVVYCTIHTSDPQYPTPDDMASVLTIK
jgi:plastocyanin